jgi:hypothetical protein
MTTIQLNKAVMRRIYLIWFGRIFLNRFTIKIGVLGLLMWELATYVVVQAVVENALHAQGSAGYMYDAFLHTDLVVQGIVIGGAVVAGLLARDTYRNISPFLHAGV